MKFLVTGGAGFIGSHLIDELLGNGHEVTNIDNFDPFYPRSLKENNIKLHFGSGGYNFIEGDFTEDKVLDQLFSSGTFDMIIHLGAKAGVRPSIQDPKRYAEVNSKGTLALLEMAKKNKIKKFIFASSSSVYGKNPNVPWSETDLQLMPISPYAASKIAAENYGKVYSELFGLNFIALRFFTVFGPRQRPDLAIRKFFELIYKRELIPFFGDGSTSRDYTFIDDILNGIMGAINKKTNEGAFEIYNLGNSNPVTLCELVNIIEEISGIKANLNNLPMQSGDVERTYADISMAQKYLNYAPKTSLKEGLMKFNTWFKETNKIS